jgi:hypothetical protein
MRLIIPQITILLLILVAGCEKAERQVSGSLFSQPEPTSTASYEPSELAHFTQCEFTDGLKIVQADRLVPRPKIRGVDTADGYKRILMIDGYRLLLAYPETRYFANLKVEKSDASLYANDKQAIIESLKLIHSQGHNVDRNIENKNLKSFDLYGLDNPVIEIDGPIGMYLLFKDSEQIVITIYFLNQNPNFRKFQNYEEYQQLRDKFLNEFTECANATKNPQ